MELMLAYNDLVPVRFVEEYESIIWTERYSGWGDFTLVVKESDILSEGLRNYKFLFSSESDRVMMIESFEQSGGVSDESMMTIKGRSLEAILEQRSNEMLNVDEINMAGPVGQMCVRLVDWYLVNPTNANDKIPNLSVESGYPLNPIIRVRAKRATIYDSVKSLCDSAGLGFRIRKTTSGLLVFGVYEGLDRTNVDSVAYRLYSEDMDNFENTKVTASISGYKNHARVIGSRTTVDTYAPGVSINVSGFDRRTLVVNASDVGDENMTYPEEREILVQRGLEALTEDTHRNLRIVDGDVPSYAWDPGTGLGSIVIVQDKYGYQSRMRVTEEILYSDTSGSRRIPTFTTLT